MLSKVPVIILQLFLLLMLSCAHSQQQYVKQESIQAGAERTGQYFPNMQGKKIGVVVNHTSYIGNKHLVDSLRSENINIKYIFTPEHGFEGTADAGEKIMDRQDENREIPLVSLYGNSFKPDTALLKELDIILFDLQDVGVRYYTYISTLHYVMEACAEANIPCMVLDRPNPNGFYIDGPVLDTQYSSFVGMHPVPLVYGMTIGEYAQMINGEGWLKDSMACSLEIVKCANYTHQSEVRLDRNPSPNLTSMRAIYLYPALGLFEGTAMSVGRGTSYPFEVYGHPEYPDTSFSFIPRETPGAAKNPKYKDIQCYGVDLREPDSIPRKSGVNLQYLMDAYEKLGDAIPFFNNYFTLLVGTNELKKQIMDGWDEEKIRSSWQQDLDTFKSIRKKYLLYPDIH